MQILDPDRNLDHPQIVYQHDQQVRVVGNTIY